MNKLLVICGPTATGKTSLGIKLAKKFNGEIVSADSRQIYRGMDIATGKDLPASAKLKAKSGQRLVPYRFNDVPVWMLDIVEPTESFSVADYCAFAYRVIDDILKRGKLPVIVGGTGFYIKALIDGIDTLDVPPNPELRKAYENRGVEELFNVLFHLDPETANNLNLSDKRNKVRLLRKIEIAQSTRKAATMNRTRLPARQVIVAKKVLFVGLTASPEILRERINKRIDEWIEQGAEDEVVRLLASGVPWDAQSMNAIGYRQWKSYFEGKAEKEEIIGIWKTDEWQYVKRQLTWFKRDQRINWFDITDNSWLVKVEELVRNWYNES